jgi:DNA-binding response OmpR family regulator
MRPKKIVLCVNDNQDELSVLKFMLYTNGYRVLAASSGEEAILLFTEIAVDLVLADYWIPKMNGNELIGRLKQIANHIPMILLGDRKKMAEEVIVADALLCKSTVHAELLDRIKVMAARKRGPRPGIQRVHCEALA